MAMKSIFVLTGAGISAESGITMRIQARAICAQVAMGALPVYTHPTTTTPSC